jgi:Legume lectin domain/Chitobiase/beta-hexosaminidase C-terminal domain/Bacterial lectin
MLVLGAGSLALDAQVSVTTWHNDIARTGQNLSETILTPSNVNATQFGKLFSQTVDGFVYAQPLYLPNVSIGGQSHNVMFIATEHDSVYAFDADSNGGADASPLWFASLLTTAHGAAAGATTVPSSDLGTDIVPEVGITGTPVIDPPSGTLYVVSKTLEGSAFVQRLHALDVTSGAEKFGGPVVITATVSGTGNGSSGGTIIFDSEWENQRPGLLLLNDIIYIGFAAHGDNGPWHGWILGYKAQTLKQTGAYCASPNGVGSGFWMSGAALAAEVIDPVNHPYGRMFVATGNGDYTATKPYGVNMDYGDSILNLDLTNGVPTVQDEFTPEGQAQLDANDGDLGAGGLLIVPTQTSGSVPHLLVQAGKSGEVYLLNRENLGGYNPSGDTVVQEIPNAVGRVGTWSMPAYWNSTVYYWGVNDIMKAFPLVSGQLTGPTAVSSEGYGFPGANPSISANGSTAGIVWTIDSETFDDNGPALLQAHNASNIADTLYSSSTNLTRDNPGPAVKFTVPTIANGKVYVGAQKQVSVFGLLNQEPQAATPVLSPGTETFSGSLAVSISDAASGATIYYTMNGSTPTTSSSVYSGPITITATTTIQAMASVPNYLQSAVTSGAYTDQAQTAEPIFSPASGTITAPTSVTISDTTTGAAIYYTTNGTTPTTSSTKYSGPVSVSATETLKAIAVASGFQNSAVASATYTLSSGQTGINFPDGFAGTQGVVILNGSTDLDDTRLQLTDGAQNQAASAWYYQPVNVQAFTTSFSFQLSNPVGNGITFAIQGNNTAALGADASGLGYQGIAKSLAIKFDFSTSIGSGTDSTGLYQNGTIPTVPAIDLSTSGINLASDDTMAIQFTYNGSILSMTITDIVTGATYSTSWTVNIPSIVGSNTAYVGFTGGTGTGSSSQKILTWVYSTGSNASPLSTSPAFTPSGGTYTAAQSVSIANGASGSAIYYTTNGTTPSTSSTLYSGPVSVNASETLKAISVTSGYGPSGVAVATYTINTGSASYINYPSGGFTSSGLSLQGNSTVTGGKLQLTNGGAGENSTAWFATKVPVQSFTTDFTFQQLNAAADGMTFTIQNASKGIWTLGDAGGGLGYQGIANSVAVKFDLYSNAGEGADSTGLYTGGAAPTMPAVDLSSTGINLHSGDVMHAHMVYDGTNLAMTLTDTVTNATVTEVFTVNIPSIVGSSIAFVGFSGSTGKTTATQNVLSWTYGQTGTSAAPVAAPTFSPAGGTYTTAQTVTISDSTSGATIYYTTNGTTPTASSTKYTGAISVGATETLEAIAIETGYSNSPVATAAYIINSALPAPVFSPAAGTYTATQSVTISDAVSGTTIYYTTNGTTPTAYSTKYSGAISVSTTETLEAIAVATSHTNSPVATSAYTISTGGPSNTSSGITAGSLSLNGGAIVNGGVLQLTNGGTGEARTAWFTTKVSVKSFTIDFTFQQLNAAADGMTFAIQNDPKGAWAFGDAGGGLGYQGIANSVAVKFDLYSNAGEGADSTGLYTGGAAPTMPAIDLSSTGINLHSGDVMHAHMVYDGTNLTMTLTDTATNATVTEVFPVNIPSVVGGNTAFVGFTGGTGSSTATQNVLSWTYVSQ